MTTLSKDLSLATVETAPKLLWKLFEQIHGSYEDLGNNCITANPVEYEKLRDKFDYHMRRQAGWISAAIMLCPKGWQLDLTISVTRQNYRAVLSQYADSMFIKKYGNSAVDPALAVASVIADVITPRN